MGKKTKTKARWDAFISHASEDKNPLFVPWPPLSQALVSKYGTTSLHSTWRFIDRNPSTKVSRSHVTALLF